MDFESFKRQYNYDTATPVIKQYLDVKFAHLDCLVLFRMGDFYELFFEDAVNASQILGIALTKRGKSGDEDIPMCGVPYHALDNYLNKLIEEGCKLAICDQLETPEEAKKRAGYKAVVARDVVRVITAGTITEESLITQSLPNYLASVVISRNSAVICYVDLGTAEFNIIEIPEKELTNQIMLLAPKEILLSENLRGSTIASAIFAQLNTRISYQVNSFFASSKCEKIILAFYNIASTKAIGELNQTHISSLGSILEYINLTQKRDKVALKFPQIISYNNFMIIDAATRRNLEIIKSFNNTSKGSLLGSIDYTITKAGARLLYKFLCNPLIDISAINHRLFITEFFYNNFSLTEYIRKQLKNIGDLERIIMRLYMNRSSPRDLLSIKQTLEAAVAIKAAFISQLGLKVPQELDDFVRSLSGDEQILEAINETIKQEPAVTLNDGGFIRVDYHPKLKELYDLINNSKAHIERLKTVYQKETGIDSLKIQHNNLLGLFIEITAKNANKINDSKFIHRQTTINNIRYSTEELQQLESRIVNAKNLAINLEKELYQQLVTQILSKARLLHDLAATLSNLDVFCSFAYCAKENNYCKPELSNDIRFEITDGRHPVIEQTAAMRQGFIDNSCQLSSDERIWLITGPNMSGKSTFLRQNVLIAVLAQIGSFVPAASAIIGIVDKIFSRIGAGDDLLKGSSTFMVEMLEVSAILAQSTEKSLVILDEVGRGTSTYDGVAIAFAVLEHIHDKLKCRCLFATHYFELTILSKLLAALKNYTVAIEEIEGKIIFLHKIIQGSADKSYGIHVAELAGLPKTVINRAGQILARLEKENINKSKDILKSQTNNLSLFGFEERV